jgi:putative membrane protein
VTWRVAASASGIVAAATTVVSPLAHLDHHLLTAHMVQHLLLMLVAAPLILFGMPPASLPQPPPVICWLSGSITVILWHLPPVFDLALQSAFWHGFERASFLVAGLFFWRPVIGSSGWSVPVYLFLATLPCDALSAFLAFCGHVVYPHYLSGHARMFGLSGLDDQELAGALMWVAVTFAYLIPALVVTARLLSDKRNYTVEVGLALGKQ